MSERDGGSSPLPAAPALEGAQRTRWLRLIQTVGPLLALFLIFALFAALAPESFPATGNLETIARQTAIVGIGALGMTLIIIMGGIDLSAGSTVALSTVVIAWILQRGADAGWLGLGRGAEQVGLWPIAWPLLAALGGVLVGALCGMVNGLLITGLRMVPFIVTLGMLLIVRGVAKGLAHEQKIDAPASWLRGILASLEPQERWMLVPPGVWIMILLALLVAGLLLYTPLGRHIFAVGSNEQTARLCGVRVGRVKVIVYTLGAACAGLAGVMQFSRLTVGDPTVAVGLELDIIAAVVIGGGSLSGGEGSVLGTLVGALIMTTIRSGCTHMGLPNWVQEIVAGAIIVVAVALDRMRQRVAMER